MSNGKSARAYKRKLWQDELDEKEELLKVLKAKRLSMLSGDAQSYSIGSRSVTKYNTDLETINAEIKDLEDRIKELKYLLHGIALRTSKRIVPRDV